jgi:alkylation response protein AidB-like acyl-CoA dehydrogenase
MSDDTTTESLESFQSRARDWMAANLPSLDAPPVAERYLQNLMFDHGFAGVAFPLEYGGAGLTLEHQKAFFDAAAELRRQVPTTYRVSIGMLAPTILEHGSADLKERFLPPLLRGDEVWIQLLSEPRGGSDMAGATTRITRDGDTYLLNGAKMWTTRAHLADYGLCLGRTNWDVPKHRGLSMVAVPLKNTAGVTIQRTRAADGTLGDFCQEFFDDVRLPVGNLVGEENHGWQVAQTLLLHERNAVGNIGYGYLSGSATDAWPPDTLARDTSALALAAAAQQRGRDRLLASRIADTYIEALVRKLTSARIAAGLRLGTHQGPWGSLSKLQSAVSAHEADRLALAVYGPDGVIWDGEEVRLDNAGTHWLGSRVHSLAGGSNEMQRNIISERLLGLPREPTSDRDVPFSEVLRGHGSR